MHTHRLRSLFWLHLAGADKEAVPWHAVKVALSLDRAVVLADGLIQMDTHPEASGERSLADKEHLARADMRDAAARMQRQGLWRRAHDYGGEPRASRAHIRGRVVQHAKQH